MTHLFQKQSKQAQFVKWLTRQMKGIYSAEFRLAYGHDERLELHSHISAKVRPVRFSSINSWKPS